MSARQACPHLAPEPREPCGRELGHARSRVPPEASADEQTLSMVREEARERWSAYLDGDSPLREG